jgi:16S rRNA (cytosine1402-N4)-methyltransferase
MENQEQPKHVRRKRYKGTHPKAYHEKYKELNPEKYTADVAKIKEQGKTPAGMHRSICVDEIMEFLNITPGQTGMDATLGYGGHSWRYLNGCNPADDYLPPM